MIALFDSGMGGVCALLPLLHRLPKTDFLYLADGAALPLGEKAPEEIRDRLARALSLLAEHRPRAVLIACGTASAFCDDALRARFPFPIFDIITPTASALCHRHAEGQILLLGTRATVQAGVFARAIAAQGPRVDAFPCPRLVPLAERHPKCSLKSVLAAMCPAAALSPAHVVLGCTHFSLLSSQISALFPTATVWDAAAIAADAMASALPPQPAERGAVRFLATAHGAALRRRLSHRLGYRPTLVPITLP